MVSRVFLSALTATTLFFTVQSAAAQKREFEVDRKGESQVQIISDAPLETMHAVTKDLGGVIVVDLANPSATTADLRAKVDAIRTGIDLRDEHLRSDSWLDSKRFPYITFEVTKVTGLSKLEPNQGATATVTGKFTMHGVTREITTKAKVRLVQDSDGGPDVLLVKASFPVKLEDYKISVPSLVRLKIANEIQVNVSLRGTAR